MWTAKDRARRLQIDLATHPAGSRPTLRMVINASCASKAASTLTVEKHPRVIRVSATPSKNPPCLRLTARYGAMPLIPRVGAAAHTPPRRRINLAMSITARECDPIPISRSPSVARTRNSIRRPSILVTSASPVTMLPTTVGARWRTLISVPTALSLGSR